MQWALHHCARCGSCICRWSAGQKGAGLLKSFHCISQIMHNTRRPIGTPARYRASGCTSAFLTMSWLCVVFGTSVKPGPVAAIVRETLRDCAIWDRLLRVLDLSDLAVVRMWPHARAAFRCVGPRSCSTAIRWIDGGIRAASLRAALRGRSVPCRLACVPSTRTARVACGSSSLCVIRWH